MIRNPVAPLFTAFSHSYCALSAKKHLNKFLLSPWREKVLNKSKLLNEISLTLQKLLFVSIIHVSLISFFEFS